MFYLTWAIIWSICEDENIKRKKEKDSTCVDHKKKYLVVFVWFFQEYKRKN